MSKAYFLKKEIELGALEEIGYIVEGNMAMKVVIQPLDSNPVKMLLNDFYQNPEWIEKVYKPNKKIFKKEYNLVYDKKGNLKMTPEIEELLTTWFITIDLDDSNVFGLTSGDKRDSRLFCGKGIFDKYCSNEVFLLKNNNFIYEEELN